MNLTVALLSTVVSLSPASAQMPSSPSARSCTGVTEVERTAVLFVQAQDIVRVQPLKEQRYRVSRSNALPVLKGSIIYVRAIPGLTVEKLQHVADCHIAQVSEASTPEPFMSTCPLFIPGAKATVRFDGGQFVVEIRSDERSGAEEVLSRSLKATASRPQGTLPVSGGSSVGV